MMKSDAAELDLIRCMARRLMRCPAVAYQEEMVAAEVRAVAREHGLPLRADAHGNLHLRPWAANDGVAPLVLVAHMDHPGFAITSRVRSGRWRARFLGGVPAAYFRKGIPLRLFPGGEPGRLARVAGTGGLHEITTEPMRGWRPSFAVWDLPAVEMREGRIRGRACDDLIGVTVLLATLTMLRERNMGAPVWGLITRAEEVGFQGALTVAARRGLPAHAVVVSLETSKEIPPVRLGGGVILRAGDRASLFDSEAMRFMSMVAEAEAAADRSFTYQRAWMTGGTCEGTAFQAFGYRTAALCVPLRNYHNCGPRGRIRPEEVSEHDVIAMARLLVAMGRRWDEYPRLSGGLASRLHRFLEEGRKRLKARVSRRTGR